MCAVLEQLGLIDMSMNSNCRWLLDEMRDSLPKVSLLQHVFSVTAFPLVLSHI